MEILRRARMVKLEQTFLSDQALYRTSGAEQLMKEILREKGLLSQRTAYVWSSPCFAPIQPEFGAFARFEIRELISPDTRLLPADAPVQTFAQVRIVPDGNTQTLMILAAEDSVSVLGAEEWKSSVLKRSLTLAFDNPSRKLVRRSDMLSPEGYDAYNPHYEAEGDLDIAVTDITPLKILQKLLK